MARISSLEPATPWVWQLKLSESEFAELETAISEQNTATLHEEQSWAKALLVYVAEWYKRCYQSGNSCPLLEKRPDIKLENAWKSSGFAWRRLVYTDESGYSRWLYSTYVLGGLAIRHELGRNDKLRFLKALCRIYHHEDYTLENIEDSSRAISFRQSVKLHSLHYYMQEILDGNLPFHAEDLENPISEVNRFVIAMKNANDEVMHDKFRLEWVVTNAPGYTAMNRTLRLWLRPEEVRDGLHQYIRYDRMTLWDIKRPEKLQSFKVCVRFLQDESIIGNVDWTHAPITFHNTGNKETGFLAVGVERCATCKDVPSQPFNTIVIIARDNNDKEYELQRESAPSYLQLWRVSGTPDQWSSMQSSQRDTAVVFSPEWHLNVDSTSEQVEHKPFSSRTYGKSEPWGWYLIYDKATISHGDKQVTLYNRQGYDRIATKLYLDTIQYENGGYITWQDEEEGDELLPLIFSSNDVIARHFATKDDITNAQPEDETEIELVEFKQGAFFTQWTDNNQPPFGKIKLRITIKGRPLPFEACYLPSIKNEHPIVRDFDKQYIRYASLNSNEIKIQDNIPMDKVPLNPTIAIEFGKAIVKVFRPTLIKEVYLDNKIINYLKDGEELNLPYIFKPRVKIADFSHQGFRLYDCNDLQSLYDQKFINIAGNKNAGYAALAMWEKGMRYSAITLDELAPNYLYITFGNPKTELPSANESLMFWNYALGTEPVAVKFDNPDARERWGVIFQDLKDADSMTCYLPLMNDNDIWADEYENISILDCFLQAVKHNVYFFIFMPLRELRQNELQSQLINPLKELHGGILTEEDINGLKRFAEEFKIDFYNIQNI